MGNLLTKQDMMIIGIIAAVLIILIVTIQINKKKKKKKDPIKEQKKIKTLERVYGILLSKKLTRNSIIKATKKYGTLSVFSQSEIKCLIVKNFRITVFGTVIILVGAAFAFKELSAILLCVYGAYTIFSIRADKQIEAATVNVYREVKIFISSLRIEYKKSHGDILVALEGATCGAHIMRAIDEIKQVLVSTKTEEHLEQFYQHTPFKQLQTLAMVCSNVYTHGDATVGEESSVFDEAMLLMEADINQKLEEISFEKQMYKTQIPIFNELEYLAIIGIVLAIALKILMIQIMPSTEVFYNSIAGLLIQDAVIAFSIYSYGSVAHAHLQQVILPDDRMPIVVKMMKKKSVQRFIRAMSPKGRKRRILEYKLKIAVSKHTVDSYWCERCVVAITAFCTMMIVTSTAPTIAKQFLETYTKSFDLLADTSSYEDKDGNVLYTDELILEMDNLYIAYRNNGLWDTSDGVADDEDKADIKKFLLSYMPTLTTLQTEDQIARLETKYRELNSVQYHWWYILIAVAAGAIGFVASAKKLKSRLEYARLEEEEEFLQLQMITLILSSLNMDTLDTLGHLANIADFHKNELVRCYYGYASDPAGELQLLEDTVQSPHFKLFVGKLKETIENLSVKEVFADLRNDRIHICNERDTMIKANISRKRASMGRKALMPMNLAIFGVMVFPLLYTGLSGLLGMQESIQAM